MLTICDGDGNGYGDWEAHVGAPPARIPTADATETGKHMATAAATTTGTRMTSATLTGTGKFTAGAQAAPMPLAMGKSTARAMGTGEHAVGYVDDDEHAVGYEEIYGDS